MKTVNGEPNILLNYLQITNPLDTCDISNFIPKAQILANYEATFASALSVLKVKIKRAQENYNKAILKADKGNALNAINKQPTFQNLIRNKLDFSQELQALEQFYEAEPLRFFDAQISKANEFIVSKDVQDKVALDFDNANYKAFDVNNGDNNCQSRIFLMDIFQQKLKYADLSASEKLVLTLCNITNKYKKEVRDVFWLLIKDVESIGEVRYGGTKLMSIKATSKAEVDANMLYSVGGLISQAISQISCGYMLMVADAIKDADLKQDLTPYERKAQNSDKLKPKQQMQAATTSAMYGCIALKSYPLAYKLTRLTSTQFGEFSLQGIALIDAECSPVSISTEPAVIFELYAVDTPSAVAKNSILESLSKALSFDEYLLELKAFGVQRLVSLCDVKLDRDLQQREVVYSSTQLNTYVKESKLVASCLKSEYVESNKRSTSGVIFAPCHVYVSTFALEQAKISELKKLNPSAGLSI